MLLREGFFGLDTIGFGGWGVIGKVAWQAAREDAWMLAERRLTHAVRSTHNVLLLDAARFRNSTAVAEANGLTSEAALARLNALEQSSVVVSEDEVSATRGKPRRAFRF